MFFLILTPGESKFCNNFVSYSRQIIKDAEKEKKTGF